MIKTNSQLSHAIYVLKLTYATAYKHEQSHKKDKPTIDQGRFNSFKITKTL